MAAGHLGELPTGVCWVLRTSHWNALMPWSSQTWTLNQDWDQVLEPSSGLKFLTSKESRRECMAAETTTKLPDVNCQEL